MLGSSQVYFWDKQLSIILIFKDITSLTVCVCVGGVQLNNNMCLHAYSKWCCQEIWLEAKYDGTCL